MTSTKWSQLLCVDTYSHQELIKIFYCNNSNFKKLIEDFEKLNYYPQKSKNDVNSKYNNLPTMVQKVLNKHAPLKSRVIRGTNRELRKAIMWSQLQTKYNKTKQEADRNANKKKQNLC